MNSGEESSHAQVTEKATTPAIVTPQTVSNSPEQIAFHINATSDENGNQVVDPKQIKEDELVDEGKVIESDKSNLPPLLQDQLSKSFQETKIFIKKFSAEIEPIKLDLQAFWTTSGIDHFKHAMDFTDCWSIYFEQLPKPVESYIILMLNNCHGFAASKYLQEKDTEKFELVNEKFYGMLQQYLTKDQMDYYKVLFRQWETSMVKEPLLKSELTIWSNPAKNFFLWSDWRQVNIGMSGIIKLLIMFNYPEKLDTEAGILLASSILHVSLKCALMNDIGSKIKDGNSKEVNYYLQVAPQGEDTLTRVYLGTARYLESLQGRLPEGVNRILRSAVDGSFLVYSLSSRFFGKTESNW